MAGAGDTRVLPVFVLTGPTGSGKTDWAVAAAESVPVDIVSVDSALVYRGMDIGTAKPSRALRERVPHRLIDICDPSEAYSAGRFVSDALKEISASHAAGRVPLLVGGTMLYLRALRHGLAALPQASPELRAQLDARAAAVGWPALHAQLASLDPQSAARISPADGQRIQRALEVCLSSGRPLSELQRGTVSPLGEMPIHVWMLAPSDRAALHQRLADRFEAMMAAGFLDEVRQLRDRGDLHARLPAMRAVGYRQMWSHLDGHLPLSAATQAAVSATRQLAKRQLTWMRSDRTGNWIDPSQGILSWIEDMQARLGAFGL